MLFGSVRLHPATNPYNQTTMGSAGRAEPSYDQYDVEQEIAELERRLVEAKAKRAPQPVTCESRSTGIETTADAPRHFLHNHRCQPLPPPPLRLSPPSRLLRLQQRSRVLPRTPQSPPPFLTLMPSPFFLTFSLPLRLLLRIHHPPLHPRRPRQSFPHQDRSPRRHPRCNPHLHRRPPRLRRPGSRPPLHMGSVSLRRTATGQR